MNQIHRQSTACRKATWHIQDELDARLQSHVCRKIRKHLERCPNCTAYLNSLKKTILLYRRFPDPHIPNMMREKLFAILNLHA